MYGVKVVIKLNQEIGPGFLGQREKNLRPTRFMLWKMFASKCDTEKSFHFLLGGAGESYADEDSCTKSVL
jgi:hypothetical protein